MFNKKKVQCENCEKKVDDKYSFCPHCGECLLDEEQQEKEFGLLGRNDEINDMPDQQNFGFADKLIGSLMNSLMKNLDKQFKQFDNANMDKPEIKHLPNGIKIKIGAPQAGPKKGINTTFQKQISDKQLERMQNLPRVEAHSTVKRINDKIIYELTAPGINSPQDIFISKLESGYEIKAIGDKKVYVNSLQVNLPLQTVSLSNNKLHIEFATQQS